MSHRFQLGSGAGTVVVSDMDICAFYSCSLLTSGPVQDLSQT